MWFTWILVCCSVLKYTNRLIISPSLLRYLTGMFEVGKCKCCTVLLYCLHKRSKGDILDQESTKSFLPVLNLHLVHCHARCNSYQTRLSAPCICIQIPFTFSELICYHKTFYIMLSLVFCKQDKMLYIQWSMQRKNFLKKHFQSPVKITNSIFNRFSPNLYQG